MSYVIEVRRLDHRYGTTQAIALDDWSVKVGEHWAIIGPSGCGKSTLLNCLAGLLQPGSGEVIVAGEAMARLQGSALDLFRGRHIGFVPQALHLIASLRARDNVLLAQYLSTGRTDRAGVDKLLALLGLAERAERYPRELSQGERQRIAIARAVVNRPTLLLADEPTANLDDSNAGIALNLLLTVADQAGATLVVATHDQRIRSRLARVLDLTSVSR